jgi:hypothetical protein
MAANVDRFRQDLDKLIELGSKLDISMLREVLGEAEFIRKVLPQLGSKPTKKQTEEILKALPSFKISYEAWYSESLALLRQLLPERLENFISYYEKTSRTEGNKLWKLRNSSLSSRAYSNSLRRN